MGLTTASARTAVKLRLDIPDADVTWDALIDAVVLTAVARLFPICQEEVDVATSDITVDDYGEAVVTLATGTTGARRVEISSGYGWSLADDTFHQGTSLYIRDLDSSITQARIYGLKAYELTTVPDYLQLAVFWYAMSEFYDYLAGNKRKYNMYVSGGARQVDNMRDESDFYEQKANQYVNDRATIYGSSN